MNYIHTHYKEVDTEYHRILKQAEENRKYWSECNRDRFARIALRPEHKKIRAELDEWKAKLAEHDKNTSLPVLTVGKISRIKEKSYREQCAERIAEIVSDLDNYLGTGRIFIP